MKKINLFLSAALVLGLAACDDKSDLGIMQTNPQENIMSANGLYLSYGENLTGDALNLGNFEKGNVDVIKVDSVSDLPADAKVEFKMQVSSTADFAQYRELNVTDGAVKADEWDAAYKELIGKSPIAQKNFVRFAAYTRTAGSLARMGGDDFYYAAKELSVTPYDLKLPVDAAYYIAIFDAAGNPTYEKMDHSPYHQYDDPVFSYLIDVTPEQANAGLPWAIVNEAYLQNHEGGKFFGVAETGMPTDLSGSLQENGEQGLITNAGKLKVEVNMLDLSYSISYAFDYIYTPGPANGWSFENNMLLTTTDYVNYYGYVYVEGEYKLCAQPDWNPLNWGTADGVNLVQGGDNIKVDTNGLYWVTVDLSAKTFAQTQITAIGMIGGFNDWAGDVMLTPSADYKTWTGEVTVADATEWKFRMNSGWDINLGGTPEGLEQNGGNLSFPAAGTYTVTLNLGSLPYTCTIAQK